MHQHNASAECIRDGGCRGAPPNLGEYNRPLPYYCHDFDL